VRRVSSKSSSLRRLRTFSRVATSCTEQERRSNGATICPIIT
jgi:hypothetical protein